MSNREIVRKKTHEIYVLKTKLKTTDYQAIKYAEGLITDDEYAPIKEQRQVWRDEINTLEAEIETLRTNAN